MKQVRLSRAFGTTPKSVYRRMEDVFALPPEEAKPQGGEGENEPEPALKRRWGAGLIALAALLLALTALLVLDPFDKKPAAGSGAIYSEAQLLEVQLQLRGVSATAREVRATAVFSAPADCAAHYFWYDGQTLPAQFSAAEGGRAAYYVSCALCWPGETGMIYSDLVSTQQEKDGALSVRLSGAWEREPGLQTVQCAVTVVRAQADGSYQPRDVQKTLLPLSVLVE